MTWLVYGTGRAAQASVQRALSEGRNVALSGRDMAAGRLIANQLGISFLPLDLRNLGIETQISQPISGILNAAGPYSDTAPDLISYCLLHRLSYIDLSNEYDTHLYAWGKSDAALSAGVAVVPGAGFGTMAVQLLLSEALRNVPNIDSVRVYLPARTSNAVSSGVRESSQRILRSSPMQIRGGRRVNLRRGTGVHKITLPFGKSTAIPISNGDFACLSRSTQLADLQVFATTQMPVGLVRIALPAIRSRLLLGTRGKLAASRSWRTRNSRAHVSSVTSLSTICIDIAGRKGKPDFWTLTSRGGLEFAVSVAFDVIDAIDKGVAGGTRSPLDILDRMDRCELDIVSIQNFPFSV